MAAYYNEHDPFAAQWLRNLIAAGHIAPGEVDDRSIVDVRPSDLNGFTQCHFFAGIGVWSYALRRAGWPDDRPVWTGSCPCQSFSGAGKGKGFADERHLWPAWYWLICQQEPEVIFGEQVASDDGLHWLDLVSTDMEAKDYAFGTVDTCAASFGAPNIRQRLYWVANAQGARRREQPRSIFGTASSDKAEMARQGHGHASWPDSTTDELADSMQPGWSEGRTVAGNGSTASGGSDGKLGISDSDGRQPRQSAIKTSRYRGSSFSAGSPGELGVAASAGSQGLSDRRRDVSGSRRAPAERASGEPIGSMAGQEPAGPTNGFWRDADWLFCRDGKWRPTEPGSFPLAHGLAGRVGRLRAYGNAINAEQATGFIKAAIEAGVGGHLA